MKSQFENTFFSYLYLYSKYYFWILTVGIFDTVYCFIFEKRLKYKLLSWCWMIDVTKNINACFFITGMHDIVQGNRKLILGLIWELIQHYSTIEDEPSSASQEQKPTKKQTLKIKLLAWINDKIPSLDIKNFTSDWKDGRAIGALVDALAPGM